MDISAENVLAELAKIGFSDMRDFASWKDNEVKMKDSDGLGEKSRVISEVSQGKEGIKIKLHDKLSALEKIAKHLGMYEPKPSDEDRDKKETVKLNIGGVDIEIS